MTQSKALLSLEVWRETNSHSSQEREAVLHCMTLSPRSLKHLCFITKTIYNNHTAKEINALVDAKRALSFNNAIKLVNENVQIAHD